MTTNELVRSLTKWNSRQDFRNNMVKGNGYLVRSALKRGDSLKRVELWNRTFMF